MRLFAFAHYGCPHDLHSLFPPPPAQVGAAVGHMPRMSFGRSRYDSLGLQPGELVPGARPLSPQAVEVASRTYVAGGGGGCLPGRDGVRMFASKWRPVAS